MKIAMKTTMNAMKALPLLSAAALLLLLASAAGAQDKPAQGKPTTLEPNQLTLAAKRPPLTLDDKQRAAIAAALADENSEQTTPPDFAPKVGATVPLSMSIDVMPQRLVRDEPSVQPFGYAKTAKDVLVIDPMKKTIVAVIPRAQPSGKPPSAADWAKTKGRELTGQAPEPAAGNGDAPEPAGDSGDKANGNEKNTNQK